MTNANSADNQSLKIGELAKRTGVSIRTLHYYDEIGLLSPVTVTKSRHRLYGSAELVRLQQIKSLRHLGFSLEEVRACLDAPEFSPARVIDMHVRRLRDQVDKEQRLIALLETLAAGYQAETVRSVQDFIGLIEEITTIERSFTPDELNEIHRRGERMGAKHQGCREGVADAHRPGSPPDARGHRSEKRADATTRLPVAPARSRIHRRQSEHRTKGARLVRRRPKDDGTYRTRSGNPRLRERRDPSAKPNGRMSVADRTIRCIESADGSTLKIHSWCSSSSLS